ncbi:MAG: DUF6794 domain-containing protein [Bacteroidota bacterium]
MIKKNKIYLILFLIFTFQYFGINAQNTNKTEIIEYKNLIQKDTINGIYIPKDISDCFSQLNILLCDSLKLEIKKMTEDDFTGTAHLSLGMWIRNNWGLWAGSRLQVYMLNLKFKHPDEMSDFILSCYYKKLQGTPIKVKQEIKIYNKKYKSDSFKTKIKIKAKTIDKKEFLLLDSAYIYADKITEISFQNFDKLPSKILTFENLSSISIENCSNLNWSKTFKLLSKFHNLKKLSLYQNQVKSYPKEISTILSLTTLWIGNDSIKILPETIKKLTHLKELSISNCPKIELSILFNQLVDIDSLRELHLTNNSLDFIPIEISKLKQICVLWLDGNSLKEFPQGIKKMQNLTYLRLFSNKIQNFDFEEGDLPKLTRINLCYNNFIEFPSGLTKLRKIEEIVMWHNKIEKLPDEISNLKNLKSLNLQNNNISNLPSSFCLLDKLEKLDFGNNNLNDSIFNLLFCLKQIKEINLMGNNIKQIPENIHLLENLEKLWLGGNQEIKTIPISFAKLIKLKALGLGDCPNLDYNNIYNALNGLELEQLGLYRNNVSIDNKQKLKKILPKTKIYY